jgi:hypothetical protein
MALNELEFIPHSFSTRLLTVLVLIAMAEESFAILNKI